MLDSVFERWYNTHRKSKTRDTVRSEFKQRVYRALKEELLEMLKEADLSTGERRMVEAKLRRGGFNERGEVEDGPIANWLKEHGFAFASPDHAKDARFFVQVSPTPGARWTNVKGLPLSGYAEEGEARSELEKLRSTTPRSIGLRVYREEKQNPAEPNRTVRPSPSTGPSQLRKRTDAAFGPTRWKTLSRSELLRLKRDIEEDVRRLTEATGGKPTTEGRLSDLKERLSYLNELLSTADAASGPAREAVEEFYRNAERSGGNAALARTKTKIHFDLSDLKVGSEGNVVSFKVKDRALSKDLGFANLKFEAEDHTAAWMVFVTLADGRPYTKIAVPKNKAATKAEAIHEAKVMLTSAGRDRSRDALTEREKRRAWLERQKEELKAIEARKNDPRAGDQERAEELRYRIRSMQGDKAMNRDTIQTTYYQHVGRTHNRKLARLRTMMDHNLKTLTVDRVGRIMDVKARDAQGWIVVSSGGKYLTDAGFWSRLKSEANVFLNKADAEKAAENYGGIVKVRDAQFEERDLRRAIERLLDDTPGMAPDVTRQEFVREALHAGHSSPMASAMWDLLRRDGFHNFK